MNTSRPGPEGETTIDCRAVGGRLHELEQGPAGAGCEPSLARLKAHVDACEACRRRHASRVAALAAVDALRRREVPDGLLDDLYASVQERLPYALPGGGMSQAFLDAPRTLSRWRRAALAASLLLVAGTAWTIGQPRGTGLEGRGVVPLHDPRHRLLETFDADTDAARWVTPASLPARRGSEDFFRLVSPPTVPVDSEIRTPAGWR